MIPAKRIIRERFIRARHFPHVEEPAWLMLVDLIANDDRKVSVSSACIASFSPPTTALRHIDVLEGMGLVRRVPDTQDRRRVWLRLTYDGREKLDRFFRDIAHLIPSDDLSHNKPESLRGVSCVPHSSEVAGV